MAFQTAHMLLMQLKPRTLLPAMDSFAAVMSPCIRCMLDTKEELAELDVFAGVFDCKESVRFEVDERDVQRCSVGVETRRCRQPCRWL